MLSNHAAFSQLTMKEARAFAATRLRATTPISLQDMTSVCCHPQQLSQSNEGPVHTAVCIAATAAAGRPEQRDSQLVDSEEEEPEGEKALCARIQPNLRGHRRSVSGKQAFSPL